MNELSVLSKQYEKISKLSFAINKAILILKKKFLNINDSFTEDEFLRSAELIKNLLAAILNSHENETELSIPHFILNSLKNKYKINSFYYDELKETYNRLRNKQPLIEKDFRELDKIVSAIGADRSATFRKMRRKR